MYHQVVFQVLLLLPFSFCVNDSHEELKNVARFNLNKKGGEGVITEFIEKLNLLDVPELCRMPLAALKYFNHNVENFGIEIDIISILATASFFPICSSRSN